jgi:hypothetical protein
MVMAMDRVSRIVINIIFCIQVLLTFLFFFEDHIVLPPILEVAGRFHPLVLHIPIGASVLMVVLLLLNKNSQNNQQQNNQLLRVSLLLISISTSLAALFGFFLNLQSGYEGDAVFLHKLSGIVLSWLCYSIVVFQSFTTRRWMFLSLAGVSMVVMVFAGPYRFRYYPWRKLFVGTAVKTCY